MSASTFLPALSHSGAAPIEWEIDPATLKRTGRWRKRQFYAVPGVMVDQRPLSQRTPCEFREPR